MMQGASASMQYLDPSIPPKDGRLKVPTLEGLRGKRIAFVENGWKSFGKMGERLEVLLQPLGIASFTTYRFSSSHIAPPRLMDQIAQENDAAILGMAN